MAGAVRAPMGGPWRDCQNQAQGPREPPSSSKGLSHSPKGPAVGWHFGSDWASWGPWRVPPVSPEAQARADATFRPGQEPPSGPQHLTLGVLLWRPLGPPWIPLRRGAGRGRRGAGDGLSRELRRAGPPTGGERRWRASRPPRAHGARRDPRGARADVLWPHAHRSVRRAWCDVEGWHRGLRALTHSYSLGWPGGAVGVCWRPRLRRAGIGPEAASER